MLGQDIRHLLDPAGIDLVAHMLQQQTDSDAPGLLPNEMNSNNPEQALDWLNALRRGLQDKAKPNP